MQTGAFVFVACVVIWALIGLGVASASVKIRRGKQQSVLAVALYPNRTIFGWYNDSGEYRFRTLIDRAYNGNGGETEISQTVYVLTTMLYWPFRVALNVCILLWMSIATILIYVLYASPQAGYVLRQVHNMKRQE